MNRFPTITSPLLRVATCVLGVLALAMALLLTSTGHADQQPASQPHAARATLTSYQQGAAGTRIAEGGTATRIAAPQQGWQCWHVFHYARAWYRVPIDGFQAPVDIGTLYYAAWVCNDGQHAFLDPDPTVHQDGCWTNDGLTGTATLEGCGAYPNPDGSMHLYGNMTTKALISLPNVPVPINVETHDRFDATILTNTEGSSWTWSTDVPSVYLKVDSGPLP